MRVPPDSVAKLVKKLSQQRDIVVDYRLVPDANHFYSQHMDALMGHVESYLDQALKPKVAQVAE